MARLIAERLTRLWGQQVIVENRVGVAGVMGTAFVAKSPPDGHTLVQCNVASSGIAVSLFAKMPYDQLRDIAPVARIGRMPNVVTVHPSVPFKSMKELVSYARANPGKLSVATGLVGTSPQLSMELINLMAKVELVNIPYKIGAQGITDTHRRPTADRHLQPPGDGGAGPVGPAARARGYEREARAPAARGAHDAGVGLPGLRDHVVVRRVRAGRNACCIGRKAARGHQHGPADRPRSSTA